MNCSIPAVDPEAPASKPCTCALKGIDVFPGVMQGNRGVHSMDLVQRSREAVVLRPAVRVMAQLAWLQAHGHPPASHRHPYGSPENVGRCFLPQPCHWLYHQCPPPLFPPSNSQISSSKTNLLHHFDSHPRSSGGLRDSPKHYHRGPSMQSSWLRSVNFF